MSRPENLYENYHAHVYFDEQTIAEAERLCTERSGRAI